MPDGPGRFAQDFSCPALLRCRLAARRRFRVRACHPLRGAFPRASPNVAAPLRWRSYNPAPASPPPRFGLLRVRSPLLAESLLFSLPPGTEMFQFPTFASLFGMTDVCLPGCPIRTSRDQGLFAPPPGFSQLITSFFASESQGIHRLPLLTFSPVLSPSGTRAPRIQAGLIYFQLALLCFIAFVQHVKDLSFPSPLQSPDPVENNGFEPLTLCLQSRCSSQLS